ncbi:hypothetical protein CSW48_10090, partial [Thermus scotoductus]
MEEHQTPPSILPLPLEELALLLQAWLQARLPEGERKPGRPRTFSDLSLFLFHLVRALLGFSSERMRRELARNPRLRKRLGLERVPSSATLSERSRKLPWPLLRGGKRVGRGRRVLAMDATLLPLPSTPLTLPTLLPFSSLSLPFPFHTIPHTPPPPPPPSP